MPEPDRPVRRAATAAPVASVAPAPQDAAASHAAWTAPAGAWRGEPLPPPLDEWFDDALVDVDDVLVAFGDDGSLTEAQRKRLGGFGRLVRGLPITLAGEWCEPRGADRAEALARAARSALDSAGLPTAVLRPQPGACSLPGSLLLRPAG